MLFYGGNVTPDVSCRRCRSRLPRDFFPRTCPPTAVRAGNFPRARTRIGDPNGRWRQSGHGGHRSRLYRILGQKRVFPLLQQTATGTGPDGTGTLQVEGSAACTILGAAVIDNRLTVRVEPCDLIHHTAWTVPPAAVDTPAGPGTKLVYL